jgi:hypothetical protein
VPSGDEPSIMSDAVYEGSHGPMPGNVDVLIKSSADR